jgi:bacterioferritin-associated ferredoxin
MYVCVCKAVTERQILNAAQSGAQTLHDLRRVLGVASECGRCARHAHQMLRDIQGGSQPCCQANADAEVSAAA